MVLQQIQVQAMEAQAATEVPGAVVHSEIIQLVVVAYLVKDTLAEMVLQIAVLTLAAVAAVKAVLVKVPLAALKAVTVVRRLNGRQDLVRIMQVAEVGPEGVVILTVLAEEHRRHLKKVAAAMVKAAPLGKMVLPIPVVVPVEKTILQMALVDQVL
jgi:phosphoribosyl-dephospho-CoA transferase